MPTARMHAPAIHSGQRAPARSSRLSRVSRSSSARCSDSRAASCRVLAAQLRRFLVERAAARAQLRRLRLAARELHHGRGLVLQEAVGHPARLALGAHFGPAVAAREDLDGIAGLDAAEDAELVARSGAQVQAHLVAHPAGLGARVRCDQQRRRRAPRARSRRAQRGREAVRSCSPPSGPRMLAGRRTGSWLPGQDSNLRPSG